MQAYGVLKAKGDIGNISTQLTVTSNDGRYFSLLIE